MLILTKFSMRRECNASEINYLHFSNIFSIIIIIIAIFGLYVIVIINLYMHNRFVITYNIVRDTFHRFFTTATALLTRACTYVRVHVRRRKLLRAWVTLRDSRESLLSALDDRGRSPFAWAFESRCRSKHVTIFVLRTGATGSSIFSFLTLTSRRAFSTPKQFDPSILKRQLLIWARACHVKQSFVQQRTWELLYCSEKFMLANLWLE